MNTSPNRTAAPIVEMIAASNLRCPTQWTCSGQIHTINAHPGSR